MTESNVTEAFEAECLCGRTLTMTRKNTEGVYSVGQVVSPEAASNGLPASNKDDNLAPSPSIEDVGDEEVVEIMARPMWQENMKWIEDANPLAGWERLAKAALTALKAANIRMRRGDDYSR